MENIPDPEKELKRRAESWGMTVDEYLQAIRDMRNAWEQSGGMAGARARLEWADNFIKKQQKQS